MRNSQSDSVVRPQRIRFTRLTFSLALSSLLFTGGCANLPRPNLAAQEVEIGRLPNLNTIRDGQAYIEAAHTILFEASKNAEHTQVALNTGIFGGIVAVALGTSLNWHSSVNTRTSILTGAAIGLDSTLPIGMQMQILQKGLEALHCVQGQAESAFAGFRPLELNLGKVRARIEDVRRILKLPEAQTPVAGSQVLNTNVRRAQAEVDLAEAWLNIQTAPVANVVAGVKNAVDGVLLTTDGQLKSVLPDGSAFSKINASYSTDASQTGKSGIDETTLKSLQATDTVGIVASLVSSGHQDTQAKRKADDLAKLNEELVKAYEHMTKEVIATEATIAKMNLAVGSGHITTFDCQVEKAVIPLALSKSVITLAQGDTSPSRVTITGGKPEYSAAVSANAGNLTPERLGAIAINNEISLTPDKNVVPGYYTLIITDKVGAQRSVKIVVTEGPKQTDKPTTFPWRAGSDNKTNLTDLFSGGLPEVPLQFNVVDKNTTTLSNYFTFDSVTGVLSSTANLPSGTASYPLTVTAKNNLKQSHSVDITITVAK